jgi:hypothetical protein
MFRIANYLRVCPFGYPKSRIACESVMDNTNFDYDVSD